MLTGDTCKHGFRDTMQCANLAICICNIANSKRCGHVMRNHRRCDAHDVGHSGQSEFMIGAPKGSSSPRGRSRHHPLWEPFSEPFLTVKPHSKPPSKNPSPRTLRRPSLRLVLSCNPLGVDPNGVVCVWFLEEDLVVHFEKFSIVMVEFLYWVGAETKFWWQAPQENMSPKRKPKPAVYGGGPKIH